MTNYQPIALSKGKQRDKKENPEENKFPVIPMEDYITEAREILTAAGDDLQRQTEAITKIIKQLIRYNNALKMMRYVDQLAKEFNIKKGDFSIAIKEAQAAQKEDSKEETESSALVTRVEQFIINRYEIYFNKIANKFMCRERGKDEFEILNEHNIYRELQKSHIRYSMSDLKSLLRSDFIPKRNVFFEYFENLSPWDGEDHIKNLSEYITIQELSSFSNEKDRFLRMFRKMFVRSIACSLEVDFNKQCFTLVGPGQNIGKSSLLRWICPIPLQDYYFENIGTSKDDLIALTENIIINIDELSTLSKYDINALKSVMSKWKIKVRLPYGERPELLQRRCNFVASTNRMEFLSDETGSVRWICFWITKINWDYSKKIDIDKVWAQAYHLFKETDFNYQLTPFEIDENEQANKTFIIRSPEMELIQKFMIPATKEDYDTELEPHKIHFRTATEILTELNQKNLSNLKLNAVNVGKSLKMLGFNQYSKYNNDSGISVKGYYLKYKSAEENNTDSYDITNYSETTNSPPF
ncbi:MAG: hypothetical protein JW833_05965 [Prolixibacteraceae bacterium]|nr:hypothetical protein [Prolixibacteraceae bacterium]